jgi:diacylglycerol O-acyltransferase / wax synthase
MRQLSPQDATMLYVEAPGTPNHVTGLCIYDQASAPEPVTFTGILRAIERRLHLARVFRERLVRLPFDLDHPYWIEDPGFDLEFHVRHLRLPLPGDWRQLCIQVARLHARPLDLNRPPWELYVIEGLDDVEGIPAGSFALVSKVHHSAIDGAAGVELVNAIHDLTPDASPPEPDSTWQPDPEPSTLGLLGRAAWNGVQRPVDLITTVGRSAPIFARLPFHVRSGRYSLPAVRVPKTRFNGPLSPHRVIEARSFPLDTLRTIKAAVPGATINDIGLAIVSGALRRYLLQKDELPDTTLSATCPVSLRSRQAASTISGNDIALMTVPLHTGIEDPLRRAAAICGATANSKERKRAIGARTLLQYSELLPGALIGLAARAQAGLARRANNALLANTTVTNVPASPVPLYFCGARMVATYGLGPVLPGIGLLHLICSYCGILSFTVTADRDTLPDPARYAECIQQSADELLAASRAGRPSRRRPSPGPRDRDRAGRRVTRTVSDSRTRRPIPIPN